MLRRHHENQLRPDLSWVWFPYLQVRKLVQLASWISSSANLLGLKNIQVCWNWPTSSWWSSEVGEMANISRNTFSILGTLTPFPHPPSVPLPLACHPLVVIGSHRELWSQRPAGTSMYLFRWESHMCLCLATWEKQASEQSSVRLFIGKPCLCLYA